jgi:DNA-directed RNA polymerase specialized sigma subunit
MKDQTEKARSWVAYVLKHHDRELRAIEDQITQEHESLQADLKRIRERAEPGAVDYGRDRVQGSAEPDARLVAIVDAIDRRQQRSDRTIERLERRRAAIEEIHLTIIDMDDPDKDVLLALYYPYRTYAQAAKVLYIDKSTVVRHRERAFNRLVKLVIKCNQTNK